MKLTCNRKLTSHFINKSQNQYAEFFFLISVVKHYIKRLTCWQVCHNPVVPQTTSRHYTFQEALHLSDFRI